MVRIQEDTIPKAAQAVGDGSLLGTSAGARISDADVLNSAKAAIEEIRRQIDHQVTAAGSVDTKGAGVLTLTGTVAGVIATRIHLDSDPRKVVGIVTFLIVVGILVSCIQAIRPRAGFSYGADASGLVALLDQYSHEQVMLAIADSLRAARETNVAHLEAKQNWQSSALRLVVAALVAVAVMVAIEGIK